MFRGVQHINMDAKGRIAMPAKHRDALQSEFSGQLIATVDVKDPCLLIYPLATWEGIEQKLQQLSSFDSTSRALQRRMLGNATELEMDPNNGRMLLPPALRNYAKFEKKLVLVGMGNKFELWNEDLWIDNDDQIIAEINSGEFEMPEEIKNLVL